MKGGIPVGCTLWKNLSEQKKRQIKKEYTSGGTTYKKLAEKYNVDADSIARAASPQNGNWRNQKKEKTSEIEKKATEKSIDFEVKNATTIEAITSLVLELIAKGLKNGSLEPKDVDTWSKIIALVDKAKSICGYKAGRDLEMQIAKLENLRAETALANSKISKAGNGEDTIININFPDGFKLNTES